MYLWAAATAIRTRITVSCFVNMMYYVYYTVFTQYYTISIKYFTVLSIKYYTTST